MSCKRFVLGQCVITPGAQALLLEHQVSPIALLERHVLGDWGELDPIDQTLNEQVLDETYPGRIFSSYVIGTRHVWVITEHDRSLTTILLPSEY